MDDIFAIRKRPTKFGRRKGAWLSLIDVDWKRISPQTLSEVSKRAYPVDYNIWSDDCATELGVRDPSMYSIRLVTSCVLNPNCSVM